MHANRTSFGIVSLTATLSILACSTPGAALASGPLNGYQAGYEIQILVDGQPAPTFTHQGETYVMGLAGERYILRVHNHTGRRIEAVVSVDGLDVVDGQPASPKKRGYLVPAWGSVDIDGWRLSNHQAAAFRFSSVRDSYAGQSGKARDVGVIGMAVFPERVVPPPTPQPLTPYSFHSHDRFQDRFMDGQGPGTASADARAERMAPAESGAPAAPSMRASGAKGNVASAPARAGSGETLAKRRSVAPDRDRPGLGTRFGEAVGSRVHEVSFVRAHATRPAVVLGVRYNDRAGLCAMGVDVDGHLRYHADAELRRTAIPFPVAADRRYARPPQGWNGW